MADYIGAHLGCDAGGGGRACASAYWLRYGATLLGLVRHHGVRAAHFLAETHRLPGLEERLRTSAHDRAALAPPAGPQADPDQRAARLRDARARPRCGLAAAFDGVITIEDMTMFGALRPKPDARMLRRVAARLGVPPCRCVAGRGHARSTRRRRAGVGMRAVWMQRYLGGRFRGTVAAGGERRARHPRSGGSALSEATIRVCQNRLASDARPPLDDALPPIRPPAVPARTPETWAMSRPARCRIGTRRARRGGRRRPSPQPARKRPRPGERRVQILQTLATHARGARRRARHHRRARPPSSTSPRPRSTGTSRARRRCSRG